MTLSITVRVPQCWGILFYCFVECRCPDCRYTKCHVATLDTPAHFGRIINDEERSFLSMSPEEIGWEFATKIPRWWRFQSCNRKNRFLPGVNVIKHFWSRFTDFCNKLECFSLATLSSLVYCLWERLAYPSETPKGRSSIWYALSIALSWKGLSRTNTLA